jgi:hypothetical protein
VYESVFALNGSTATASPLATGPWDPGAQHGGAPAALLMRAFERLPAGEGLQIARVTYEFLRPVPVGRLAVQAEVVRPGRRVQLLEASVANDAGIEVVRARALQVQRARMSSQAAPPEPPPPPPEQGRDNDIVPPHRPLFAPDAVEIRFIEGRFAATGPSVAWFRLRVPLVAGETPTPLQHLAAAGDFGNGISAPISWDDHVFINPDLTLYIERPPTSEWICLDSRTRISGDGVGLSESVLYDLSGRVGRATQALVVAPR